MNKTTVATKVAEITGLSKTASAKAVEATLEAIKQALVSGDDVQIMGFGTFKTVDRAARTGRNPKTGEEIQIDARKAPVFKAGKTLKDAVQ
jgi:nucleoid DNA-binding protein